MESSKTVSKITIVVNDNLPDGFENECLDK